MTYESMIQNIDDMPQLSEVAKVMQSLYTLGTENVDIKKKKLTQLHVKRHIMQMR